MKRFLSALFLCALATTVSAAAPSGVMNLQATAEPGGAVKVTWDAVDGTIAYYRVYYAVESILESGGAYDDYDETEGPETEYLFEENIPEEGMYLAVMAVNMDGEESEYFMEEVQVLPVANPDEEEPAPVAEPTPNPAPSQEQGSLSLLSAKSTATDAVELTFSMPVQVRPKSAATAFRITKAGGETLMVKSLQGEGLTLTLTTEPQQGVVYQVQLTDALRTELGVTFDEASRSAFFTGTGDAPPPPSSASSVSSSVSSASVSSQASEPPLPPSPAPQQPQAPQGMQNISGLRLRVSANANGTFNVTGEWDLQSVSQQAAFLLVGQSFDAGKTFVSPNMVPANATQVNIQGVPPGHFGLLVQVMDAQGNLSSGVFETAWLGKGMPTGTAMPVQPSMPVASQHTPPAPPPMAAQLPVGAQPTTGLPHSGAGFLAGSMALAGMAVGWQRMRKRTAA